MAVVIGSFVLCDRVDIEPGGAEYFVRASVIDDFHAVEYQNRNLALGGAAASAAFASSSVTSAIPQSGHVPGLSKNFESHGSPHGTQT